MTRIGMMLSRNDVDAPLAQHFGKAKWLLVVDGVEGATFVRNEGLSGGWVAAAMRRAGVTDVVTVHLGAGARDHLRAAGIRVWMGAEDLPARELAARAEAGRLAPFPDDVVPLGRG